MGTKVRNARIAYQRLVEVAALSSTSNPRARASATPQPRRSATPSDGVLRSVESQNAAANESSIATGQAIATTNARERTTVKAEEYRGYQRRPNVHIGLHYERLMEEYGLIRADKLTTGTLKDSRQQHL